MANTIILKRSATPGKVPTTAQLALGEIAINTYDGLIFIKKDNGTPSIAQIGGVTSVNSETGAVTLTTDDISDSGQTNKWASASVVRGHLSAGTGISYNSGTGVISTAQNLSTAGSPSFAGLTLTGNATVTGDILPSADNVYSLGSASYMWKDVYVGPGSLYVNGQKVLEDNSGTITFSADAGQSLQIKTTGAGNVQLSTEAGGVIQVAGTLQISSGKNITDSAGVEVNFGDNIDMNSNKIVGLGAPSSANDAATKTYVDTAISAISTSAISQGNSNVTVSDTGTGTVTVSVDGSTALTVSSTGVVVAGNFTVQGTTTTVESNTISLADNIITLNSDATGSASQNAGLEVERGDDTNVQIRWNEGTDKWTFTNDGATYYPMAVGTDDLAEGSTNLYHTTARARGAISASSATGVSYNSTTGAISLGSIPNSSLTNNSITINGTSTALGGTRTLGTDDVAEGSTNLYFSNARARGAVSFTAGSGAYNSTTGVFTIPTNTNQLTNGASFITLSSLSAGTGISYNNSTGAISTSAIPNASLSNSAITVNSASTSLGGSVTLFAGTTTLQTSSANQALTGISSVTLPGSTSGSVQVIPAAAAGTGTVLTLPATTGTVITTGDSGTVTNTMLAGSIANAKLANSSVTVGTTAIALGASSTTLAGLTSVTSTSFVGALTGNASTVTNGVYTTDTGTVTNAMLAGSIADTKLSTISSAGKVSNSATTATSANTASAIVARDASGNFTAGTITAALTGNASTATTLATARNIQGVSFNGSADITVVTAGTGISVSGTAVTNTGVLSVSGTAPISASTTSGATTVSITAATTLAAGSMSAADKSKLDGIASGATANTGTVTSVAAGSYLTGGTITTSGTLAVDATSANTASKVVARDASGNFSAGTITANLTGNTTGTHTGTATGLAGTPNITVGTITSGAIAATGSITATGEITAYFSDERLKTDINPIEGALDKVMAIGGYTYKANDLAHELGVERFDNQIGLLAQEVEAVMPELVTESGLRGYKTIRYDKVVSVLVQAIKEQQAMIAELQGLVKKTLH